MQVFDNEIDTCECRVLEGASLESLLQEPNVRLSETTPTLKTKLAKAIAKITGISTELTKFDVIRADIKAQKCTIPRHKKQE